MVHDWPQEARLLTPLEREFILSRLAKEQGVGDATLTKSITKQAFLDWKMWAMMLAYIGAGEPLYSYVPIYLDRRQEAPLSSGPPGLSV